MSLSSRLAGLSRAVVFCALSIGVVTAEAQAQLTNPSFETPTYSSAGRTAAPAGASWTFAGTAGIERFQATGSSPNTGGFNGMQAAYLSGTGTNASLGSVAQSYGFPAPGWYTIRFLAGRLGAANALRITVGGTQVDSDLTPRAYGGTGYPHLESWWTQPFWIATAGPSEIKFASTNKSAKLTDGSVLLIDQVVVASLPFSLPNSSFEATSGGTATGWTLDPYAGIDLAATAGAAGNNVLRVRYASYGGSARTGPIAVPAGRYSLSARVALNGTGSGCAVSVSYSADGTNFTGFASIPAPTEQEFTPYTTDSVNVTAGTYYFMVADYCAGTYTPVWIDSLLINRAGPTFVNAGFEVPDLGDPANAGATPRQTNPAGAGWSFSGSSAGIQGNPGLSVSGKPFTSLGKQYGNLNDLNGGSISQTVTLDPGTYVVVTRASNGPFTLTVNGVAQSATQHGTTLYSPPGTSGYLFAELMSEPFMIAATGSVNLGFAYAGSFGFSIDAPRIVQVMANAPPAVMITAPSLATGKSYALVQGPGPVSVPVTATASDPDGLAANSLQIFNGSTQVGSSASTSPFGATVTGLTAGTYTLKAVASDTFGLQGNATVSLKVNNPPQGGFSLTNGGVNHVAAGQTVSVTITALPSDSDGAITQVEFLQDGAVVSGCTRTASPWTCTVVLSPRGTSYNLTARATDDDGGVTTYAASTVTVNAVPSVTLTAPANGSNYGVPATITLTANAADVDGTITKVEFFKSTTTFDASTLIGTVTTGQAATAGPPAQPAQSGSAYTYNWLNSTVGSYPIAARATDDRGGTTLSSQTVGIAVSAASTTTVSVTPSPSTFGQSVTMTATVAPNTATGSVDFNEGATTLCTAVALSGTTAKTATCTFTPSSATTHTYTANYSGMTGLGASSGNVVLVVNKQTPTLVVTSAPSPAVSSQLLTLTATLSPLSATGSVDFKEGTTAICVGVSLIAAGSVRTASCVVPAASVTPGPHTYTANYLGDGNSNIATGSQTLTVLTASSTAVTVAPNPSTFNATRTITATVTPNTATGTVNFTEAGTSLPGCAAVTLSGTTSQTATCVVAATAGAGGHTYTASYAGDAAVAASTGAVAHTINKATAAITIATSPSTPTAGQTVVLTATVAPNTATGSVDFTDGLTTLCSAVALTGTASKTATCTVASGAVTAGPHNYTTNYSGDTNHTTATFTSTVTVKAASTVALSANPAALTVGQPVILTATLSPNTATGTVTFMEGATAYCTAVALSGTTPKTASCTVAGAAVTAGSHTYTANYSGDSALAASTVNLTVLPASTTVLSVTPNPSTFNLSRTITATVTPNAATGTVGFTDGGTPIASCAAVALVGTTSKTATCTTASGAAGSHTYAATYSGDAATASSSGSLAHTVNKATPTLSGSATPSVPSAGQTVTLTATSSLPAATGTVQFMEGTTTLCAAAPLTGNAPDTATCAITPAVGTHTYTLNYSGDINHNAATYTISLTVAANAAPTVYIFRPSAGAHLGYLTPQSAGAAKATDADSGVATIQMTVDGSALGAPCTFTPAPGVEQTCVQLIPSNLPIGNHTISATATDAFGATATAAAVTYTIDPAPITCRLTANPATVIAGGNTTLTATCTAYDGLPYSSPLQGATIAWTGACAASTTVTDASGIATCTTAALSAASTFSITASKVNYSAANPAATITVNPQAAAVSIASFSVGGQSGTVASVVSGTNAVVSVASTGACASGDTLTVSVNGTPIYGPGTPVVSVNVPITSAATYQALASRSCTSPAFSVTSPTVSLTVLAVTEPALPDIETAAVTASLTATGEVAGSIPGSATVDPSGAVTYSIGIPVAPGSAGMQPTLVLQYSSQGGRGIVGTGWSLSGFSTIHRCPASIVIDNFKGRIGFDGDDRYCMDGMRLIAIVGANGADGSEYRTERDSYARIYSYGNSGTGPTSWTVETKSGQKLTFGKPLYKSNTAGTSYDSSRIKAWGISRAEDTVGNYMTFSYQVDHGRGWMLPLGISYTGNAAAGQTPYAAVEIAYEATARSDATVVYDGSGSYGETPPLVSSITSRVDGSISQQLNIEYASSPTTGRTRLASVQLCGSGATTATGLCLAKTTFTYNDASVSSVSPWLDAGALPFSINLNDGRSALALDLNGDGKTEILQSNTYYTAVISNGATACSQIGMCNYVGNNGAAVPLTSLSTDLASTQLGDFNGDGFTDFVMPFFSDVGSSQVKGRFVVCLGQPTGAAYNFSCEIKVDWEDLAPCYQSSEGDVCTATGNPRYRVGDLDGDGRSDVLMLDTGVVYFGTPAGALTRTLSTGTNFCVNSCADDKVALGDFDGDGRMDLAVRNTDAAVGTYAAWTTYLSRMVPPGGSSVTTIPFVVTSTSGPRKKDYDPHIADLNGDGLADLFTFDGFPESGYAQGTFKWQGCSSIGNGTFACNVWRGPATGQLSFQGSQYPLEVLGDFNGDGRTDVAVYDFASSTHATLGGAWWVCVARPASPTDTEGGVFDCGPGVTNGRLTGGGVWPGGIRRNGDNTTGSIGYDVVAAGDFNGDGRTGLAGGSPIGGNPHITRPNVTDPVAKVPDLLSAVSNGLGFVNSFTYKPITDSAVYTKYDTGNA